MQGVGFLLSPLLAMLLVAIFGDPAVPAGHAGYHSGYHSDAAYASTYNSGNDGVVAGDNMGWSWRLLLGLGALPGILLLPFKVKETAKIEDPQSPKSANQIRSHPLLHMSSFFHRSLTSLLFSCFFDCFPFRFQPLRRCLGVEIPQQTHRHCWRMVPFRHYVLRKWTLSVHGAP